MSRALSQEMLISDSRISSFCIYMNQTLKFLDLMLISGDGAPNMEWALLQLYGTEKRALFSLAY